MIFTIEISHYPLQDAYEGDVISFIQNLRKIPGIVISTNAMSTQLKGEHEVLMPAIGEIIAGLGSKTSSTVMKIIPRDLPIDAGEIVV